MQAFTKTTIRLSPEEVRAIIRSHFNAKDTDSVDFSVGDIANDPLDRYSTMGLTGVSLTMDVDTNLLRGKHA